MATKNKDKENHSFIHSPFERVRPLRERTKGREGKGRQQTTTREVRERAPTGDVARKASQQGRKNRRRKRKPKDEPMPDRKSKKDREGKGREWKGGGGSAEKKQKTKRGANWPLKGPRGMERARRVD